MQNKSFYNIPQKKFIDELILPALPGWDLEIIPHDYVESPEKCDKIIAILTNKKDPTIIKKATYHIFKGGIAPFSFGSLISIVTTARYPKDYVKYQKLFYNISANIGKFFGDKKAKMCKCHD